MRLVIPYVMDLLEPATIRFGTLADARFIDVGDDDFAYWRLFARLWHGGQPFAICEHDIVPTMQQWDELQSCAEPWCVFGYDHLGTDMASMGFCKFVPGALAATLAMEQWDARGLTQESRERRNAYALAPGENAQVPWGQVDGVVWTFLTTRGYHPHRHPERVMHLRRDREGIA